MINETVTLEQLYASYSQEGVIAIIAGIIIGCLFVAFFGFRFIKIEIILSAALTGYEFGASNLGLAIGDTELGFDAGIILGIACAVIFGLLAIKIYKAYVYFLGGVFGVIVGLLVPILVLGMLEVPESVGVIAGIVAAVLLAVPAAKLFYKLFKGFYIFSSSIIGMVFASAALSLLIFGENDMAVGVAVLIGVVLSVPAMIFQAKINAGRTLDD